MQGIIGPIQSVPPQVVGVTVESMDSSLLVSWSQVVDANTPVASYSVRHRVNPAGPFTEVNVGNVLNFTILGLINGTLYDVQVAANNSKGQGQFSDIVMGTPESVPDQVQNLIVLVGVADNSLDISWDAVVPAPTFYTYEFKESTEPDSSYIPINIGLNLSDTISSLKSGILYNVRVHATNVAGDGPNSAVISNTPEGVPETVIIGSATAGIEQVQLLWMAPSASPPLTGYNLEYKQTLDSLFIPFVNIGLVTSQIIFDLLGDVEYQFRIQGINSKGVGIISATVTATPTNIAATLSILFNEGGIDPVSPVTFNNNLGSLGSDVDLDTVFGTGANLSAQVRKEKRAWQSTNTAGLEAGGATLAITQPYTIFQVLQLFFLDANTRISMAGDLADNSFGNDRFNSWSGTDLPVLQTPSTSDETIAISRHDGASSNSRILINDGPQTDVNASGNAGTNQWLMESIAWNPAQSIGRDLSAQFYEHRIFDGLLSVDETDAVIGAYQQKWWFNFPFSDPTIVTLVEFNNKGVGLSNPVTLYKNTGLHGQSYDLDGIDGDATALTPFTRNSLACLRMGANVGFETASPNGGSPAIIQPSSFIICFNPLFIDTAQRVFQRADGGNLLVTISTTGVTVNAGLAVTNLVTLAADVEIIVIVKVDGASSSIRVIENGGTDTTQAGDLGANSYSLELMGWDFASTPGLDLAMIHFESKYYDAVLNASEELNEVSALQTKWFTTGAVPVQVTGLVLTAISGGIQVDWSAVGGAIGYVVEFKISTDDVFTVQIEGNVVTADILNLSDALYDVRVTATNSVGQGPYSVTLQETPTLLLMVWDETGIVSVGGTGTNVTTWNNTGSTSGNNDYDTVQGTAANLQENVRNSLAIVQANGGVNLFSSNTGIPITSGYTIYLAGIQFTQTTPARFWFSTVADAVSFSIDPNDHFLDAGVSLQEISNGQFNPVVFALIVNGASSRMVASGGLTFDLTGDAGSSSFQPDILFWDNPKTVNRDFNGQLFEKRLYNSVHDTTTITNTINELKTKWAI